MYSVNRPKHSAVAPSSAMSRKTRDVIARTFLSEKEIERPSVPDVSRRVTATELNIRERHGWPKRQAFNWRAVFLVFTSDRACGVAAKQRVSVHRQSEDGSAQCGVSEILGSSGVRAMSP